MRQRRETVEHPFVNDQGPDGSNPLPHEDAATGCRRDGAARAPLQPDAGHEHTGHPTAPGGDEGIVVADMRPSAAVDLPRRPEPSSRPPPGRKSPQPEN
jgi:hypothetical protein